MSKKLCLLRIRAWGRVLTAVTQTFFILSKDQYMKYLMALLALILLYPLTSAFAAGKQTTSSGLSYEDEVVGTGAEAVSGKTVSVHYTGWLNEGGKKGKKFDSSVDRNSPFDFPLGAGMVIKGWDEGVAGMKVGGKRTLYIPAKLGYGERGAGGAIPPNADLIFDVELLGVH
jgi:peptidylprolyl isomerase